MRRVSWTVERSGQRLHQVLDQIEGAGLEALREGRVFVRGSRARDPNQLLEEGDRVEVYARRPPTGLPCVLDLRGGLVAVSKPAGMPTEPDRTGLGGSLVETVAAELGLRRSELHPIGRLDVAVSGVVLLARGRGARVEALRAQSEGRLIRRYVGLVSHAPDPRRGEWHEPCAMARTSRTKPCFRTRPATSRYACLAEARAVLPCARPAGQSRSPALLVLEPITGRFHQLRLHAARAGIPFLGDRAYAGPTLLIRPDGGVLELSRIALHAVRLTLLGGASGTWRVEAPIPPELEAWWRELGGPEDAWSASLELEL